MARSKSSKRWLQEHFNDNYVKQAQKQGYRSRSAFKLLEIQQKDQLIKPGQTIIDLGAAPGGWSQVLSEIMQGKGRIIALDILPMDPLAHVEFIQGDFREPEVLQMLLNQLGEHKADLVISDMAPNTSGIESVDQPRAMYLAELAEDLALQVLKTGGMFLVKIFQGQGSEELIKKLRQNFQKIIIRKPKASRARSREAYLLAKGYNL
jgi:23S rRNA (uridine2552-2'-O)-methyltransferase